MKTDAEQLKAAQEKAAALAKELQAAEIKLAAKKTALAGDQQSQEQRAALQQEVAKLKQELAEARQQTAELTALRNKAAALAKELQTAQAEAEQNAALQQEIAGLKQGLARKETELAEAKQELKQEIEQLKTALDEKTTALEQAVVKMEQLTQTAANAAQSSGTEEPRPASETQPADSDGDGVADAEDLCPGTQAGATVNKMGCEQSTAIVLSGVNFALGTAELTEEARQSLRTAAALIKQAAPNQKFEVAGYTDSRGSSERNQIISQRRANAVRNFLARQGISWELMVSRGYGQANPVADNATAEGRAKNRRVELHLLQE
jgi:outer membrane protein OmpA-like peptidoglycan-associated protein